MAIPVIKKGDTSKEIALALADGYPFAGCALHVGFCGVERTFENLTAGGTVALSFSAEETAGFPLGTSHVTLSLRNAAGSVRTLPFAKIKVSDSPSEVYDAAITIDPGMLNIEELPARFNDEDVHDRVNAIISWMKRIVPMVALCALPALGDGLTVYTAQKGRVYNDEQIVTNVVLDLSSNNTQLVETIRAEAPAPGDYATVSNKAMTALQSFNETDPNVPSWAKASSKPTYTLNEVAPNSENWIGVQGNAGRIIKILAQGSGSSPAGGFQVTASTLNNNNTTTYAFSGVAVKRNGMNTDYLWDETSSSGIVRRSELASLTPGDYANVSNRAVHALGNTGDQTLSRGRLTIDYNGPDGDIWLQLKRGLDDGIGLCFDGLLYGDNYYAMPLSSGRLALESQLISQLAAKADVSNTYTRAEVDSKIEADFTEWRVTIPGAGIRDNLIPIFDQSKGYWVIYDPNNTIQYELIGNTDPDATRLGWASSGPYIVRFMAIRKKLRPTKVSDLANDVGYIDATTLASATNTLAVTIPDANTLATNLVQTVIHNSIFNLTYDDQYQITWQKVAEGGAFYERCYTNLNMIGVSP